MCLPMFAQNDIAFQVFAEVSDGDKATFEQTVEIEEVAQRQTVIGAICTDCTPPADPGPSYFNYVATWRKLSTGDSDLWVGNFFSNGNETIFTALPVGSCFNICFHVAMVSRGDDQELINLNTIPIECSDTCFQKITDTCYTSLFTYQNKEDSMSFIYTDGAGGVNFFNSVRINAFLGRAQFPKTERTYRKSDQSYIKLFARIDEEYELFVDWFPKGWHSKVAIMIDHDTVTVTNKNDGPVNQMQIVCTEAYDIEWPSDMEVVNAPARTKVRRAQPLHSQNNNCN